MTFDCSRGEIGVFINTSLGTRVALSIPPATTAALLIREVERVHFNCLPCFGEIMVQCLMNRADEFHISKLPGTGIPYFHIIPVWGIAPLICALRDRNGPCFLHATAVQKNTCNNTVPSTIGNDVFLVDDSHCQPSGTGGVDCSMMSALESNLEQNCHLVESKGVHGSPADQAREAVGKGNRDSCVHSGGNSMNLKNSTSDYIGFPFAASEQMSPEENVRVVVDHWSSENSSATRSVTDIIRRHYSATDTLLESQCLKFNAGRLQFSAASPASADRTPRSSGFFMLQDAGSGRLGNDDKRPDVGQRLLMASSKLGISPAKSSPVISMSCSKRRKHLGADMHIRNPVFELSENSN
ncbi:unnamed protein product [Rhodiola kirilowii]